VLNPLGGITRTRELGAQLASLERARLKCQNSGLQLWLLPLAIINHGMEIARFFYIETLFLFFPLLLLMIEKSQNCFIF